MSAKKKSSVTTKLFGFAIVTAIVVFGAKNQMLINDPQTQRSQLPMVAVPVDRSQLSQQVLPALPAPNFIEFEKASYSSISKNFETSSESNQEVSQMGPSPYKLKLSDQKAWACQPLQARLASATKQPVGSSRKIGFATSQSPIVPGHEDPHLWYESHFLDLAVSLDDQQRQQLTMNDPIEFKELPKLLPDNALSAPMPPNALPIEPVPVTTTPVAVAHETAPSAKPFPAPAARVAHDWETGRY